MDSDLPPALDAAQSFLASRGVSGKILFVMITGSQAYDLADPNSSDTDYMGAYLAPTKDILAMEYDSDLQTIATRPGDPKPDCQLYEAVRLCDLLRRGNPFTLELLFCPWNAEDDSSKYVYESASWKKLKEIRKELITKKAIEEEYLSYIHNQYTKYKEKGMPGKRVYHALRLLFEVKRMIRGELPVVKVQDQTEKDLLWRVKKDQLQGEELDQIMQKLLSEIDAERPWNLLPDEPPIDKLNDWLVQIRMEGLMQQDS